MLSRRSQHRLKTNMKWEGPMLSGRSQRKLWTNSDWESGRIGNQHEGRPTWGGTNMGWYQHGVVPTWGGTNIELGPT